MTWEPTFDSGFPSQLFVKLVTCAKAWVLSAASRTAGAPSPPRPPPKPPILNDAFSKPHICDCLYCAFPRNHLGEVRLCEGGGGSGLREAIKAFRTLGIFLLISSTPRLPTTARFKNQNIFPKLQMRAMIRSYTYEPTKFKQDTQGCQKNLFQVINYLLFLLPVQFIMLLTTIAKK